MKHLKLSLASALVAAGYVKGSTPTMFRKDGKTVDTDQVNFERQSGTIGDITAHSGYKADLLTGDIATAPSEKGIVSVWKKSDAIVAAALLLQQNGFAVTPIGTHGRSRT